MMESNASLSGGLAGLSLSKESSQSLATQSLVATVQGLPTRLTLMPFMNGTLLLISQTGRLGSLTALSTDGPAGTDTKRLLGPQDDLRPSIYGSHFAQVLPSLFQGDKTLYLGLSLSALPLSLEDESSASSFESERETLAQLTEILKHLLAST